jgi:hypothetical protein
MNKHTPGPWNTNSPDETLVLGPDRQVVATTLQDEEDYQQNYDRRAADAILISAAPELLEALKGLERLASRWAGDHNKAIRAARAAIAKASA